METEKLCENCQAPVPAGALRGLCPACLLKVALATATVAGVEKTGFTPPTVEEVARKFPQLEVIELIGRGGMGAVYKARQRELDRIVALKILPPGIGDDAGFAERFTREAKALARLNHPGIVTIHDFGRADGLYFFVMEFVDGVNLRQLLATGRVSPREALAIVPQICDALQFAHDQGIVHRDIKPENILLDRRGWVKVADFGVAKIIGTDPVAPEAVPGGEVRACIASTDAGKIMGTPAYMAPEQAQHPGDVDHRADIYALGVVFYQMLTGELPGLRIEAPSRKVHIDLRLDAVVLRALEGKPELRYQQVSEVKTAVETIAATEPALPDSGPIQANPPEMKCFKSSVWDFALDIPKRWNSFPAVPTNSPAEVIRFASREDGSHLLIIFREPRDPKQSDREHADGVQTMLASKGFANFVNSETSIGSSTAQMLDFDKPRDVGIWSCRHYFIAAGTLRYTLGFGTTNKAGMFGLFDRVAKSFAVLEIGGANMMEELVEAAAADPAVSKLSPPWSNFTPRAQQVLALARSEAERFDHNFIGTEHLLIGLAALGQGAGVTVLGKLGLNLETIRHEVEKLIKLGPVPNPGDKTSFTPRAKRVFVLAIKEASMLRHKFVGTEHILLGLLMEPEGVAAQVFRNRKIDAAQTRQEILKALGHAPTSSSAA